MVCCSVPEHRGIFANSSLRGADGKQREECVWQIKKTAPLLLNVDASEVLTQFGELLKLLELPASSFQGIPEHVVDLFF